MCFIFRSRCTSFSLPMIFCQLLDIKQRRDLSPRSLLLRVIPDNVCLTLLKLVGSLSVIIYVIIIFRKCIEHILPPTKNKHVHGIMGIQGYPPKNATNPRNQELITGLLTTNDPLILTETKVRGPRQNFHLEGWALRCPWKKKKGENYPWHWKIPHG